jgi:uncharacterized protein (TIGR02246 family)
MEKNAHRAILIDKLEGSEKVFQDAVNAGDLEGLLSLYEPDAVFVPAPNETARSSVAIRQAWADLLALKARFSLTTKTRHQVGDIALEATEWKLEGTDPDGNPMTLNGFAAVVHRRRPDGTWRLLIDNPFPLG